MTNKSFTLSDVEIVAKRIGLDFVKFTPAQLLKGMNHELEHSDVTSGDPDITAKIAIEHLTEDAEYYTKIDKIEKKNAMQKPQVYYCKHIEPGLCAYGEEKVLINNDTLKKMNASFTGLPAYVFHVDEVNYTNIQSEADGYVVESFYNKLDNWNWAKFIIVSDKGHEAIAKGWSVSNAYMPTRFDVGGQYHAIPYNKEITDGYYTHLALVPDPRYESAKILTEQQYLEYCQTKQQELDKSQAVKELTNSKSNGGTKKMKFNFFKKVEVKDATDLQDAFIQLENGKEVSIAEMATALQNSKKNEDEDEKSKVNMDAKIKVGEDEMSVKELVSKYNKLAKKNEDANEDEEDIKKKNKKNEEDEGENAKKNEEETEKEKEEEDKKNKAKKNANFNELKNAHLKGEEHAEIIETTSAKLARGHSRYGSKE